MSLAMTTAEREAFLRDVHVAIIAISDEGRGPLAVPIWYSYEATGELQIITDRDSRKGQLIARHRRFSLCVQTETAPYRYVSVEGPVTAMEPVDVETHLRPLARRYLGQQGGDRYVESTGGQSSRSETVVIRMRPEHWLSVDYGKSR
jgi:nitroimidazol reductase NimA-like FMN-containing flavoprotein (pyridoxamine 5'-phosphate oxidase superfamily)